MCAGREVVVTKRGGRSVSGRIVVVVVVSVVVVVVVELKTNQA